MLEISCKNNFVKQLVHTVNLDLFLQETRSEQVFQKWVSGKFQCLRMKHITSSAARSCQLLIYVHRDGKWRPLFSTTATVSSSRSPTSTGERDLGPKWHHNSRCSGLETETQHSTITRPAPGLTSPFFPKALGWEQHVVRGRTVSTHLNVPTISLGGVGLDAVIKVNSREMGRPFEQKDEFYNLNHLWPGACRNKLNA